MFIQNTLPPPNKNSSSEWRSYYSVPFPICNIFLEHRSNFIFQTWRVQQMLTLSKRTRIYEILRTFFFSYDWLFLSIEDKKYWSEFAKTWTDQIQHISDFKIKIGINQQVLSFKWASKWAVRRSELITKKTWFFVISRRSPTKRQVFYTKFAPPFLKHFRAAPTEKIDRRTSLNRMNDPLTPAFKKA